MTEQNLMRGKEVFLDRCVGCHGLAGDGKGPGARFLSPPPADFTDKDDACCGGDTGPGDFYYRILRGWPGTAMENFGDRLSVNDIWRVVLFLKTIPNDTLEPDRIPEPRDYIVWQPSKELLAWVKTHQPLTGNADFEKRAGHGPVHAGGDARLPRPRAGRPADAERPGTHAAVAPDAAAGIKALYQDMLDRAWSDARARGEKLPTPAQKAIPPTVPGQQ